MSGCRSPEPFDSRCALSTPVPRWIALPIRVSREACKHFVSIWYALRRYRRLEVFVWSERNFSRLRFGGKTVLFLLVLPARALLAETVNKCQFLAWSTKHPLYLLRFTQPVKSPRCTQEMTWGVSFLRSRVRIPPPHPLHRYLGVYCCTSGGF